MVNQVKNGIYPQLELPWQPVMPMVTDTMDMGQAVSPEAPMAVGGKIAKPRSRAMEPIKSKRL